MAVTLALCHLVLALSGCGGCDANGTYVTHLEGSPPAVRAATFDGGSEFFAIGGDSAFGLAALQSARTDSNDDPGLQTRRWMVEGNVPAFDANAQIVGTFALSSTQLFAREAGVWTAYTIPINITAGTAFAVRDTTIYAVELGVDGSGG